MANQTNCHHLFIPGDILSEFDKAVKRAQPRFTHPSSPPKSNLNQEN